MTSIHKESHTPPPPFLTHGPPPPVSPEHGKTKQSGTHVMGPPSKPKVHVDHQNPATWTVDDHHMHLVTNPYIQYSLIEQKPANNPVNNFKGAFNQWTKRADTKSRNIWHNLKLGQSVPGAACVKINVTAKALNEGGFESLFKQSFDTNRDDKLKKWFACYLSTTTGPVSGTLFISTAHMAFCSDRPLLYKGSPGQGTYSYYKIIVPLASIGKVNPVVVKENPQEKYIQIVTIDGHDFWFMGFVSFEKATHQLFKNAPRAHAIGLPQHAPQAHGIGIPYNAPQAHAVGLPQHAPQAHGIGYPYNAPQAHAVGLPQNGPLAHGIGLPHNAPLGHGIGLPHNAPQAHAAGLPQNGPLAHGIGLPHNAPQAHKYQ